VATDSPSRPKTSSIANKARAQAMIANMLADGLDSTTVARRLANGDPLAYKRWRARMRRWMMTDTAFQELVAQAAMCEARLSLPAMTKALIQRGKRGRVDAIKLLYESTGYHNPRVQHEHKGDIKVTIDMPRPQAALPEAEPVDAEVVDE
jgi:hypothetical protein